MCFDAISEELQGLIDDLKLNGMLYSEMISVADNEPISSESNTLEQVFTISYTSGTSGNSKGVMLTNQNFLAAIVNIGAMA